jgi:electron transport complex protein RnfA
LPTFGLTLSSCLRTDYNFLLAVPCEYLKTIAFILMVAALYSCRMFLKKNGKSLYDALGIYLPLITTNCAVLGVALINVQKDYSILTGTIYGFATALGYWLAIVILAHIREKTVYNDVPAAFKGFPIVMITSGLMSIAFFGFAALK